MSSSPHRFNGHSCPGLTNVFHAMSAILSKADIFQGSAGHCDVSRAQRGGVPWAEINSGDRSIHRCDDKTRWGLSAPVPLQHGGIGRLQMASEPLGIEERKAAAIFS